MNVNVDENKFFRESTIRICGSLDIEVAMRECMGYITEFIPADRMLLQHYEPTLGGMRTIATATPSEGERSNALTRLSSEMQAAIERMRQARRVGGELFVDQPEINRVSANLLKKMLPKHTSFMFNYLDIDDQMLGAVVLISKGENLYTAKHRKLFSLLRDPFAIAMVNARRHAELVRLKNTLADDNRYLYQELHRLHGNDIVGADTGLKDVMAMVRQVAPLESPVLLLGETGVGKDVIANSIHMLSPRNPRPFITVNSGAIVMGGAVMERDTTILPLSMVLKEMYLTTGVYWGSPTEPVNGAGNTSPGLIRPQPGDVDFNWPKKTANDEENPQK